MSEERSSRARVLVVSDDDLTLRAATTHLAEGNFVVSTASDARGARTKLRRGRAWAAVIVDATLDDGKGMDLCRALVAARQERLPPIVLLTEAGSPNDRVTGLEAGADDCLAKPFSGRELVLRVAALLRRVRPSDAAPPERVALGRLSIDPTERRALVGGRPIALTPRELALLTRLARPAGFVQSREALLDSVWHDVRGVGGRTIDAYVMRLREKLGTAGVEIETVHGVGYRLRTE